ncbi:hypothetical protein GGS21DRAFT_521498 [Xylaria nigripes]|nr:hypothetical protein GGS21DRAFT_521498 [Xylaria nigripes]
MVTRTLCAGFLASSWFLAGHVIGKPTTAETSSPVVFAPITSSTFVSPSLHRDSGGLSDTAKISISIGVTLGSILLVATVSILYLVRRRSKPLPEPESLADGVGAGNGAAKAENDGYYMRENPIAPHGAHSAAPNGFVVPAAYQGQDPATQQGFAPQTTYHATHTVTQVGLAPPVAFHGGHMVGPATFHQHSEPQTPITPIEPIYTPPGQAASPYTSSTLAESGLSYPSQLDLLSGRAYSPSAAATRLQPPPGTHFQQLQEQYQQALNQRHNTIHTLSGHSSRGETPVQDLQITFLQDYTEQPEPGPSGSATHDPENPYYVHPPAPNTVELPEQRRVLELGSDGLISEAP